MPSLSDSVRPSLGSARGVATVRSAALAPSPAAWRFLYPLCTTTWLREETAQDALASLKREGHRQRKHHHLVVAAGKLAQVDRQHRTVVLGEVDHLKGPLGVSHDLLRFFWAVPCREEGRFTLEGVLELN